MNKRTLVNTIITSAAVFVFGSVVVYNIVDSTSLNSQLAHAKSEYVNNKNQMVAVKAKADTQITQVEKQVQGVSTAQLEADTKTARNYFEAAFTWTNAKEYNAARANYIKSLGDGNSFVTNFLKENVTVEVSDPSIPNNYIDTHNLKSQFDSIVLYPMSWKADGSVQYTAIVYYYVYQKSGELTDTSNMSRSSTILQFSMTGDTAKDRTVSDVSAYSGSFDVK